MRPACCVYYRADVTRTTGMADDIDFLLNRLKSEAADHDLAGLRAAVSRRIREQRTDSAPGVTMQLAVVCGALVLGLAVAELNHIAPMPRGLNSETIVLSDDSVLAPSVRLAGGS